MKIIIRSICNSLFINTTVYYYPMAVPPKLLLPYEAYRDLSDKTEDTLRTLEWKIPDKVVGLMTGVRI